MTTIRNSGDLLQYIIDRVASGDKAWWSHKDQRITGIPLAYQIAANHADKMSPEEVADYVIRLNDAIHDRLLTGK